MRVWSIQIPITYYNIDDVYGNTCFWISEGDQDIPISIPPGNYNTSTLTNALNVAFTNAGFSFTNNPVVYDTVTFKITLNIFDGVYTPPANTPYTAFTISTFTNITFYNSDKALICNETCIPQALHVNETLGYIMGFQDKSGQYDVDVSGNIADSVVDLFGPRYFILVVDDFTQNHLNNGMVTITEPSKLVKLPSYYTSDHPYVCVDNSGNSIPIKSSAGGSIYVDFSGPIQENQRTYFGPVDIERLRVRLLDDKGNTLNLNGANWSFTLLCELLYQY